MSIIACPKCGRQYKLNGDMTGKSLKCANCEHLFKVGPPAANAPIAQRKPSQPRPPAAPPLEDNLGGLSKLFPSQLPSGPDPLANHVIEDPGFAEVDVDEIRYQRELEVQKKSKLASSQGSGSSLDQMEEEKQQKKANRALNQGYFSGDTLFGFEGRIPRQKFWISNLVFGLVLGFGVALALVGYLLFLSFGMGLRAEQQVEIIYIIPLFIIYGAGCILSAWVNIALHVKRYHDLGHSGMRVLIVLIPIIGPLWVLIECGFKEGNSGKNRYGANPLKMPPAKMG